MSYYLPEVIFKLVTDLPIPKYAVEFGAYDGITISNIRKLLENGWKGLWIEPCEEIFKELEKNIKGLDVEILNIAISNKEDVDTFYNHPKHLGGSSLVHPSDRNFSTPQGGARHDDKHVTKIQCKRLESILGDREVGFMSIDTEDMDTVIIEDMMKSKVRPHIFVAESKKIETKDTQFKLVEKEYKIIKQFKGDTIYSLNYLDVNYEKIIRNSA